ncbi:hypothetical protein HOP54_08715 [Halomonas daqingensis]|uniref:hypothetical protein n=1 Tax=Billgrantia desiderata TaxID=52021 RepID=UPI00089F0A85|nr:hypothetical protein [Halomonas desiderata]MCE8028769.1 hypothetical protein [Halomonas desiderata]SEG34247.1 hypothetical protein SAMN04487953_12439 [Halomonas desiderata]
MQASIKRWWGGVGGLLLAGCFAAGSSAWAASDEVVADTRGALFLPVQHPLAWHREHWRQRRQFDPTFTIELPWFLFDPYLRWGYAPRPDEPERPATITPRERGTIWRDDVVGTGSGERLEVHPEGRILRSRPR